MIDKKVVSCDFMGIKSGYLVRFSGKIGVVIDRFTAPRLLDEGHNETYDPMLVVLIDGRRRHIHVEDVEVVDDDS